MTVDVAFSVCHANVTGEPETVEKTGSDVNDRMRTAPTFTVTLAWIWPLALVAVSVYVVVCDGVTVAQSFGFRLLPTPGVIVMFVEFVICQHSLVDCPASIVGGFATNVTTCGTVAPATMTVTGAVTLLPSALVAVRVYVVVVVGDTVVLPLTGTVPTPLMLAVVAPFVAQLNVDCWPDEMVTGFASNRRICGLPAVAVVVTAIETVAVVVPFGPVAVRV